MNQDLRDFENLAYQDVPINEYLGGHRSGHRKFTPRGILYIGKIGLELFRMDVEEGMRARNESVSRKVA